MPPPPSLTLWAQDLLLSAVTLNDMLHNICTCQGSSGKSEIMRILHNTTAAQRHFSSQYLHWCIPRPLYWECVQPCSNLCRLRYVDYVLGGSSPSYGSGGAITQWYTNAKVIQVGLSNMALSPRPWVQPCVTRCSVGSQLMVMIAIEAICL